MTLTIWARVKSALAGMGLPVENNRLLGKKGEKLPDRYITYQVISTVPEAHVDDREVLRSYLVQVNLWSRDGFESFPDVEAAMSAAGFLFQAERDMDFTDTDHFGQSKDFLFIEETA